MNTTLLLSNFAGWCFQVALLTLAATAVALALRIPAGRGKLWFWQMVLALSIALPLMGPWQSEVLSVSNPVEATGAWMAVTHVHAAMQIPWPSIVALIVGAGCLVRLGLLLIGVGRLRRYRLNSVWLQPPASWGNEAEIRLSRDVASPVTFGFLRPVILLPVGFPDLPGSTRDAILCHEVLHVRRRDWLFTLAEEAIRGVFWFHPAIWWVIDEIQLAREQTVDAEVVSILNAREQYVDALLSVAGAGSLMDLAPAPLFLRKRHLKQRLISLLKECSMSKTQRISTLAASFALLAGSCWTILNAVPMTAAPQYINDGPGVTVNTSGLTVLHRSGIAYPAAVAARGVEGVVQVQVKLDATGAVADASVLSGPDDLRKAVLASVLDWHFSKAAANSVRQISVTFDSPKPVAQSPLQSPSPVRHEVRLTAPVPDSQGQPEREPPTIRSISFRGISDEAQAELISKLPVQAGDKMDDNVRARLTQAVRDYDEHLAVSILRSSSDSVGISIGYNLQQAAISSPPMPRFGAEAMAANLVQQTKPIYPPLAKAARVQGTVKLDAIIGTSGQVENLRLISGPPLLVQAAMAAVQEWVYKPTLLNGQPTPIATTIDINFTLSQ